MVMQNREERLGAPSCDDTCRSAPCMCECTEVLLLLLRTQTDLNVWTGNFSAMDVNNPGATVMTLGWTTYPWSLGDGSASYDPNAVAANLAIDGACILFQTMPGERLSAQSSAQYLVCCATHCAL